MAIGPNFLYSALVFILEPQVRDATPPEGSREGRAVRNYCTASPASEDLKPDGN